ncbi:hypothetical protein SPOG_01674 [Schizosaccharomyces cryophilus OY26]|uniref:Uncharacterized protein n=1 Tax=Schizosaccharomyces cryophilus (strain OY26 / ATCC MYA-4695 / CBS 11777 / NBRC 106824 / NRRL Y48691) TaxID=653667 RepID=S9VXQ4_SCHCR|nr:uncharacterized protein SPOG_01674 [Schizosaccharomyces cryophilus OY26]EPY52348.1 hypothetical protein SPOG_01674 [Schizosaccharomyces cryophilus OY26]
MLVASSSNCYIYMEIMYCFPYHMHKTPHVKALNVRRNVELVIQFYSLFHQRSGKAIKVQRVDSIKVMDPHIAWAKTDKPEQRISYAVS